MAASFCHSFVGVFKMTALVSSPATPAKLIDVRAVAELLDCSPRHVYRCSESGRMPRPIKLGNLCRWSRAEIERWIADGCPSMREEVATNA